LSQSEDLFVEAMVPPTLPVPDYGITQSTYLDLYAPAVFDGGEHAEITCSVGRPFGASAINRQASQSDRAARSATAPRVLAEGSMFVIAGCIVVASVSRFRSSPRTRSARPDAVPSVLEADGVPPRLHAHRGDLTRSCRTR